MKIKCPFCTKELGNADYRATVHTNAYHDLREKIHEKIESLQNKARQGMVADYRHG